jgi:hypothetical protein
MKVTTDLRAGNVVEDVQHLAGQATDQVVGFVSSASQEAQDLTAWLGNTANSVWQTITSPF